MTEVEIQDATGGFAALDMDKRILERLDEIGFTHPTAVQQATIPAAMLGRDCVAQAKTGTGKTAAFLLPMLQRILIEGAAGCGLVLCPTRELAKQTHQEAGRFGKNLRPLIALAYGGMPIKSQLPCIRRRNHIVVGTPGRIIDFYKRRELDLQKMSIVVLDEADRMFDLGFRDDIEYILGRCPKHRQTLLLSATMPREVMSLAKRHLDKPERFLLSEDKPTVEGVMQIMYTVADHRKHELLQRIIKQEQPRLSIVFTRTKRGAAETAKFLKSKKIKAEGLHGDLPQYLREKILGRLKAGRVRVLVATDVASRGLDIQDISHVINFDIPEDPEDYVHRIGRTARMGKKGKAITLVTPEDGNFLTAIEFLINMELTPEEMPDFDTGVVAEAQETIVGTSEEIADAYETPSGFGEGIL